MATKPFIRRIVIIFLFITFLLGIYFCIYGGSSSYNIENFEDKSSPAATSASASASSQNDACKANTLVRRGEQLFLYNSEDSSVPPVTFKNLDEYVTYLEKQRENGIRCPVLYLQEENNAQGENVFRIRPSYNNLENGLPATTTYVPGVVVTEQNGGYIKEPPGASQNIEVPILDSTLDNLPFNAGYTPFDPYGQNVGDFTKLDAIHRAGETQYMSDNPMDPNWGGPEYSKEQVLSGKYDENLVMRPNLVTPKN